VHPSQDTLDEYVVDRLADSTREHLEEHLITCTCCQDAIEEGERLIMALRDADKLSHAKAIDIETLRRARALRTRFA
jgi:hypothetical protein